MPAGAEEAGRPARAVPGFDEEQAAGAQAVGRAEHRPPRVGEVGDHLDHGDEVEGAAGAVVLERHRRDIQPQRSSGRLGHAGVRLDPLAPPPGVPEPLQDEAGGGPDVEDDARPEPAGGEPRVPPARRPKNAALGRVVRIPGPAAEEVFVGVGSLDVVGRQAGGGEAVAARRTVGDRVAVGAEADRAGRPHSGQARSRGVAAGSFTPLPSAAPPGGSESRPRRRGRPAVVELHAGQLLDRPAHFRRAAPRRVGERPPGVDLAVGRDRHQAAVGPEGHRPDGVRMKQRRPEHRPRRGVPPIHGPE